MAFSRHTSSGKYSNERPQLSSWILWATASIAKDAFAFGIDLQSQLAAVQLEDRQIIHRFLDRDFPFGRTPAIFRAMLVTEDGLDGFQVERRAAAVDQGLKHLVHVRADLEDQVATVFDLVVGVLV